MTRRYDLVWQNARQLGGTPVAFARALVADAIANGANGNITPTFMFAQNGTTRMVVATDLDEAGTTLAVVLTPLLSLPVDQVVMLSSTVWDGLPAVGVFTWFRDEPVATGVGFPYRVTDQTVTWLPQVSAGVDGGVVDQLVRHTFARQEPVDEDWAAMAALLTGLLGASVTVVNKEVSA